MNQTTAQIVHESETQRQHIQLKIPAQAKIQGTRYALKDLSSGGAAIQDISLSVNPRDRISIDLILPFQDFSLDITLAAEIQHMDKNQKVMGVRFTDLNPNQIAILNHVIKAFIAGDIVGGADILNVVSRDNFVSVRKNKGQHQELTGVDKARVYGVYGLITLVTLAFAYFLIMNIMEKNLILKSPNGMIHADTMTLSAPTNGKFELVLPAGVSSVKMGQKIGKISKQLEDTIQVNEDGSTTLIPQISVTDITSPCDCFIAQHMVQNGQYTSEKDPLVQLVLQKSSITISALVPTSEVHRLKIGGLASMTIAGTRTELSGKISDIQASDKTISLEGQDVSTPASEVLLMPDSALSMDQVGRPVLVEFKL